MDIDEIPTALNIMTLRPKLTRDLRRIVYQVFQQSSKSSLNPGNSKSIFSSTTGVSNLLCPRSKGDLSLFAPTRLWIPTSVDKAVSDCQISKNSFLQFTLLSYNVLAQNLLETHPYLYRDCAVEALEWSYRWQGIQREIMDMQPDIVCLQEVQMKNTNHFLSHYEPFFDSLGYKYVMMARTGGKDDGCVILYKEVMFTLDEMSGLEFKVDGIKQLDRDNIGLVCRLLPIKSPTTPLVIGTTHLLYNPKRIDIRLCQTAMFLAELDRLARTPSGTYLPTILTGDLNSDPLSPVVELLTRGSLQYEGLRAGRATLPRRLLPDSLGLSDSCQWKGELILRGLGDHFSTGSGEFSHKFKLQSVYSPGSGVTTFQDKWTMVDYIMYSSDQLKLVSRLELPDESCMKSLPRIPSHMSPSDHLPLVAHFQLTC